MSENPNYYAILTAEVRYDKRLSPNAKLLYAEITALCGKDGKCWAKNSYFAELYEVSKKSISRWVNELVENGYIKSKIIYKKDTKEIENRYLTLSNGTDKNVNTYGQKHTEGMDKNVDTPMDKKVIDNNTRENIINIIEEKDKKENPNPKDDLLEEFISDNPTLTEKEEIIALDFIQYRKKIKKPLKTIEPLKAFFKALSELQNLGYSIDYCIEQMKANEWQTIKPDYIHKPQKVENNRPTKQNKTKAFIEDYYKRKAENKNNPDENIIDTEVM
ncbi:helix-turn-helix domain-containing protein [Aliarcobacter butzleri]|uniref:helix-turn-helix domain-containing protein n=1 Tax=Aliarcobacter butzleri TaxID=28197 RepID=UPI003B217AB8